MSAAKFNDMPMVAGGSSLVCLTVKSGNDCSEAQMARFYYMLNSAI
jgi:hypothetical protein